MVRPVSHVPGACAAWWRQQEDDVSAPQRQKKHSAAPSVFHRWGGCSGSPAECTRNQTCRALCRLAPRRQLQQSTWAKFVASAKQLLAAPADSSWLVWQPHTRVCAPSHPNRAGARVAPGAWVVTAGPCPSDSFPSGCVNQQSGRRQARPNLHGAAIGVHRRRGNSYCCCADVAHCGGRRRQDAVSSHHGTAACEAVGGVPPGRPAGCWRPASCDSSTELGEHQLRRRWLDLRLRPAGRRFVILLLHLVPLVPGR
jgi:hypothetical protein